MKRHIFLSLAFVILTLTSSCSGVQSEQSYPKDPEDRRRDERGKLTGEGGLVIFGKKEGGEEGGTTGIGINSYLWRATLDTVSFMPLASADPFGGVIVTDWYEDPAAKGERYKLNILIMDQRLRSNAVKVSVFKQRKDSRGNWASAEVGENTARELEDKILTRARQLKVNDASK